jgi:hypothetical protein
MQIKIRRICMKDRIKNLLDLCIQAQESQTAYDIEFDYGRLGLIILASRGKDPECFMLYPGMIEAEEAFSEVEEYLKGLIS